MRAAAGTICRHFGLVVHSDNAPDGAASDARTQGIRVDPLVENSNLGGPFPHGKGADCAPLGSMGFRLAGALGVWAARVHSKRRASQRMACGSIRSKTGSQPTPTAAATTAGKEAVRSSAEMKRSFRRFVFGRRRQGARCGLGLVGEPVGQILMAGITGGAEGSRLGNARLIGPKPAAEDRYRGHSPRNPPSPTCHSAALVQ